MTTRPSGISLGGGGYLGMYILMMLFWGVVVKMARMGGWVNGSRKVGRKECLHLHFRPHKVLVADKVVYM